MTGTETAETKTHCLRCGRRASGTYGSGCAAKIRSAAKTIDLSAWTSRQIEDARELIWDGGVIPTARPGAFRTVSHDGASIYLTSARNCSCSRGAERKPCFHRCAVVIILAANGAAPAEAPAPAPVVIPPVIIPAPVSDDIWARLEQWSAAEMAMA